MEKIARDLKFAVRMLRRRPGLTVAAILCLALGLGATTVVFSFVDAVLLRPLPYPEADRVMVIWNHFLNKDLPEAPSSGGEFEDHRANNRAFEPIAGGLPWTFVLATDSGDPERITGGRASAALFDVLGTEAARGRTYSLEEERQGARVVVLGHDLWERRFGSDPDVVGTTLNLDEAPYEVIGVLKEDFRFPLIEGDLWVPFTPNPAIPRRMRGVTLVGRMAPGVGEAQAEAELTRLADRFQEEYPDLYTEESGWGMHAEPIREAIAGDVRPLLWSLFGAVLLVLAIACANVANLQLARATERGKEIALRTALGAGRGTLVRQLLTESVLLGLAGGALGIVLAFFGTRALVALDVGAVPRLAEVSLDWRVLVFALVASLLTGLLFGLAPAWRAFRPDLQSSLKEGGKTSAGGGSHPLRTGLVVAEIALALTVLIAAGLMVKSFQELSETDPGFRTADVVTTSVAMSPRAYPGREHRLDLYGRLGERLAAAPEVSSVALASDLPLVPRFSGSPTVDGWEPAPGMTAPVVGYQSVSPEYFEVMGLGLLEGRGFEATDNAQAARVVIVDDELARRYWGEGEALNRRLTLPGLIPEGEWLRVVGVVDSLEIEGITQAPERRLYIPYPQFPTPSLAVLARTNGDGSGAAGAVRRVVRAVDPGLPLETVRGMDTVLDESIETPKVNSLLFTAFGLVALLLASIGVYGVMSYSVAQRTREIGVRMALGSERKTVMALILGRGMLLAAAGLALGLVVAFLLARALSGALGELAYGVSATDLGTFVLMPLVLAVVALVACWWPARRATKVNPTVALRYE